MDERPIQVLEYVTEDGRNPFREWLETLRDREARARIEIRINRVRLGNFGTAGQLVGVCKNYGFPMALATVSILGGEAMWSSFC